MLKRREHLEIIKDILDNVNKIKKCRHTRLLHKSNLSPQMFKQYMEELLSKNFIEDITEGGIRYFKIKDRGLEFLKEYKVIENFVSNFGL